jgi:hypothetical protein
MENEKSKKFNIQLVKLLNRNKFKVINSDIFLVIHQVNYKLKEIFDVIRNFIFQFEDYRRKFSKISPDKIRESRDSISDSFSMFHEIIDIINKLNSAYLSLTLKVYEKLTAKALLGMNQKINEIQRMKEN